MSSIPGTAPRLIAATVILLGCASGATRAPSNAVALELPPSAWTADPCVIADTTVGSADTVYAIGVRTLDRIEVTSVFYCGGASPPDGEPPLTVQLGAHPAAAFRALPVVVPLAISPGTDMRELLDGAAGHRPDVLVTSDANVIAYAASHADYFTAELPWSTTYVLVPSRASATIALLASSERNALARDAVTTSARGAAEPFPWRTDSACAAIATEPATASRAVIVVAAGDTTARELAERIVSLAGANPRAPWLAGIFGELAPEANVRVEELPADSIRHALATGRAVAAVLPIARDPRVVCFTAGNARVAAGAVPLIDVRDHVVVRRGSGAAFVVGQGGSLLFFRRAGP